MFAVLVPVGPGQQEVDRLRDTLDSLRAFEDSDEVNLLLVDDNDVPRDLASAAGDWASCEVLRTPLWRDGTPDPYSAMVAGTIEGMRAAARREPEFLLKLDTDALIIGPVADKLRAALSEDGVGLVGSYTHTCSGARRDWTEWETKLRRAGRPIVPGLGHTLRFRSLRDAGTVRRLIRSAAGHGYEWGANCLGGAYAAGPQLLNRRDLLHWQPWVGTWVSEDVVVGLLASAGGLSMRGSVDPGDAFAIAWRYLPYPPERLIDQGYSVIHSVRDQAYGDERELRAYFRSRRHAAPSQ
ncbi:MAG TPA: hypothetical protein VMF57_03295 [Solirubrobacteraceae bacterium]|nr:hypothetical protein [Solirubrobacteraceae bacterium]